MGTTSGVTSADTKSTDPSAPTKGIHPTPEEALAALEDEVADYRAAKAEEQGAAADAEAEAQAPAEPAPAPKASTSTKS